jgi:hypothetical protein
MRGPFLAPAVIPDRREPTGIEFYPVRGVGDGDGALSPLKGATTGMAAAVPPLQWIAMDVRIGVIHTPRELEVDVADGTDADALAKDIEKAIGNEGAVLWVTDRRGKRVAVPASKVAYVEIDAGHDERRVGFGAALK